MTAEAPVEMFAALGDPTRFALLTRLVERGSGSATSLAKDAPVTRQAVDRHLRVLEDAGLLASRRVGRQVVYTLEPAALARTTESLVELGRAWEEKLLLIKEAAEAE